MIKRNGYGVESHDVTTDDGYILQIYRVISKQAGSNEKKQPVYLEHGILLDSDAWTFVGERSLGKFCNRFLQNFTQDLAYSLVDDGYDVWLGNQRGTPYSRRHETLKTTDLKYWDYK
jgi:pimeloyl-ACP methyl ester carboxylesterase